MNLKNTNNLRSNITNWILIFFLFILLSGAFVSELFQAPITTSLKLEKYRLLFGPKQFEDINYIQLTNHLGTIELEKKKFDEKKLWFLTNPKSLLAKSKNSVNEGNVFSTFISVRKR